MNMKKSWMQRLSLALSVVLLIVAVVQGTALSGLREELKASRQELGALTERLDETEAALEAVRAIQNKAEPSVRFANASVDTENRMLTVDIVVELPDEEEYSPGIGFCQVGEPYRMAWKVDGLSRDEDGTYTMTATFPLDLEMGLELRLEDDTVLYSGAVTALLPLQLKNGSASWHYNASQQTFYLLDCVPTLTDLQGGEIQPPDGVCRVYRNGELVVEDQYLRERDDMAEDGSPEEGFAVPCAPGDHIRLSYVCTDEDGLCYEFPIGEWAAQQWDDAVSCPLSAIPAVTWPE